MDKTLKVVRTHGRKTYNNKYNLNRQFPNVTGITGLLSKEERTDNSNGTVSWKRSKNPIV